MLIEEKLDRVEQFNKHLQGELDSPKQYVLAIEKNNKALEKGFRLIEECFARVNRDLDEVQLCTKHIDNLLQKNNLHMRVLQEHAKSFHEQLFLDLDNSNSTTEISFSTEPAFRVGCHGRFRKTSRNRLIKFPVWDTKAYILLMLG